MKEETAKDAGVEEQQAAQKIVDEIVDGENKAIQKAILGTGRRSQPTGETYTADGPVQTYLVYDEDGKPTGREQEQIVTIPFQGFPKKWRARHEYAFCLFTSGIALIKEDKARQVPMLFEEIEKNAGKTELKDLEQMGLIATRTVQFFNKGKKLGGRKIAWVTPLGRGLENELNRLAEEKGVRAGPHFVNPPEAEQPTSSP